MTDQMSPEQRRLARHALGLPNARRRSYRNRFYATRGSANHRDWSALVASGAAVLHEGEKTLDLFTLTKTGALAALDKREKLCPEDFPND